MRDEVTDFLYRYVINNNPDINEEDIDNYYATNSHELMVIFKDGTRILFDTYANLSHRLNISDNGKLSEDEMKLQFRRRLQIMMNRKWVNQEELARRIGSSQQMISRYLTGQSIPGAITLKLIADALECSTDDFYERI